MRRWETVRESWMASGRMFRTRTAASNCYALPRKEPLLSNLTVLNPTGYPPKITAKPMAPRLDTLNGKTVYLVDCRFDDSDVFLKEMQGWFKDHMPSVDARFIQIRNVYTKDDPETWQEIRENGAAAIVGVGH